MKIGFDGHFIRRGVTGNGVSAQLLVQALAEVDSENDYVIYVLENGLHFRNRNFQQKLMHSMHAHPQARFLWTFPLELLRHPVDIFHGIFTMPYLPARIRPKVVLTVPEIPWFTDPGSFPASHLFSAQVRFTSRYSITKADRVITLTDFMKGQLARHLDVPEDKIDVIPWGVDEAYFDRLSPAQIEPIVRQFSITQPYILCVGDLHPRKNQIALIRAYTQLREKHHISHELVLVGRPLYNAREIYASAASSSSRTSIKLLGYISFNDLQALYQGASMFVFPSLHEGFGLPVHEAMASAIPVITSDRDALPEVAGDAALFIDPLEIDSIARAILRLIDDTSLKEELMAKGLVQARHFSWRESAKRVVSTYRKVYLET